MEKAIREKYNTANHQGMRLHTLPSSMAHSADYFSLGYYRQSRYIRPRFFARE